MRRVRFEPEDSSKRQVVLTTDLIAMQDLPAKYVHHAFKLLNLTSSTGAGLRIKINGLQVIPATSPDETVTVTPGAGATGGAKDEDSPIVELLANQKIYILDDTVAHSATPTEVKKNSIVFGTTNLKNSGETSGGIEVEIGFKVKEKPTGAEKTVIDIISSGGSTNNEVVVAEDMTPDAAPASAATIRRPGKAADATLGRIDTISIAPVTVETDDDFTNADETRTFIDVNVKEGAGGRETTKDIRTRFEDAFVIQVRQGEPAVTPSAAVVPADELPIANVTVDAGVTVINESDIADIDEGVTQFDDRFPVTFFDIVAAENLDDFDVIRIRSTDGKALKADSLSRENSKVIGIIPPGGAISIGTNPKGQAAHFGIFTKVGAGFQSGRHLYLLTDGKFDHEEAFDATANVHKVPVGMAITTEKFIFFGGRRVMAEDIPIADSASNFIATDVEGALGEVADLAAGGLKFIVYGGVAQGTSPSVAFVPANATSKRLLIFVHMSAQIPSSGGKDVTLSKNGTPVVFSGTSIPMEVHLSAGGSGRHAVSSVFLLVAGTDYDETANNTFAATPSASNEVTTIAIFGS